MIKKKTKIVELNDTTENEEEVVEVKQGWSWKKKALVFGGGALAFIVGGWLTLGRKKPEEEAVNECQEFDETDEEDTETTEIVDEECSKLND